MSKASIARVRRRLVRKGVEAEMRRRGVSPDHPEVRKMIEERIERKEQFERNPGGY